MERGEAGMSICGFRGGDAEAAHLPKPGAPSTLDHRAVVRVPNSSCPALPAGRPTARLNASQLAHTARRLVRRYCAWCVGLCVLCVVRGGRFVCACALMCV